MSTTARERKILVVDDSEICCEFVQVALQSRGIKVFAMTTHFGFVKLLRQETPDAVLVDVSMPSISGPKLIELALKKRAHDCVIVLYSDRPEAELERLAAACGATGYIRKSSSGEHLYSEIQRLLLSAKLGTQ